MAKANSPDPDCIPVADEGASLASLAKELRALGVRPEDVLHRAILGERVARAIGPTLRPVEAIQRDVVALHSPSVLKALHVAATRCRNAFLNGPLQEGETPVEARERETKLPQALLMKVSAALRTPDPAVGDLESLYRITRALATAKAVQVEADRLADLRPGTFRSGGRSSYMAVAQARRNVAAREGISVGAMQARIKRAFEEAPRLGWPNIMPKPPKKRRA